MVKLVYMKGNEKMGIHDSHKYRHLSVSKLMKLDKEVRDEDRIVAIHEISKMKPEYRNKRKDA